MSIDSVYVGFFLALVLTILIEGVVYLVYKRDKNLILASVALNLATNPLLNFVFIFLLTPSLKYVIPAEILVVIVEYLILSFIGYRGYKYFILVFIANLISFGSGIFIFGFNF